MSAAGAHLFSFRGRLRRRDWWLTSLAIGVVYYFGWRILTGLVWGAEMTASPAYSEPIWGDPMGPLALNLALTALSTWILTAIGTRRVHDSNRSAWPFIVTNVFTVAISYAPNDPFSAAGFRDPLATAFTIAYWVSAVASLYYLVVTAFLDGTPGPNRFGPSPKGIGGRPIDETADVFS